MTVPFGSAGTESDNDHTFAIPEGAGVETATQKGNVRHNCPQVGHADPLRDRGLDHEIYPSEAPTH